MHQVECVEAQIVAFFSPSALLLSRLLPLAYFSFSILSGYAPNLSPPRLAMSFSSTVHLTRYFFTHSLHSSSFRSVNPLVRSSAHSVKVHCESNVLNLRMSLYV